MKYGKASGVGFVAVAIASLSAPATALAHGAGLPSDVFPVDLQSWVPMWLSVAIYWYGLGLRRMEQEKAPVVGMSEMMAFAGGIAVLFVALLSPIDTLGGELFSVHMVQHLLLMLAAPPLLVHSRAPIVFFWAFAPRRRRWLGRWWVRVRFATAYAALMHPAVVWTASTGTLVLWHIPAMYQWALADPVVHTFEHLDFFVTSLAFWTLVIEPSGCRRLGYGITLIFVATAATLGGFPGALMIFASRPLYPAHAEGVSYWGLTLIEDQQLAGLLMWIPGGFVHVASICWLFQKWLADADRKASKRNPAAGVAILLTFCDALALSGGAHGAHAQTAMADVAGDASQGAALIRQYGCGGCHTIPSISGADGLVGPPLNSMGRRIFIAGVLRNSPENMMAWLEDPQRFMPGNAMPNMGISRRDAQNITAYLYSLR
jgi:cytochrome c oxidase assembly factor CtaG